MKRVTLEFKDEREKEYFLGQLSDGWGENYVELDWDSSKGNLEKASTVMVTPICVLCEEPHEDCECED
jgi:hypothetical protein